MKSTPIPSSLPTTFGALKASGFANKSIRQELRDNLEARLREGRPLSSAVLGYEDTVLPQLETALLAGHDIILLGERGQAKTRMIRSLTQTSRRDCARGAPCRVRCSGTRTQCCPNSRRLFWPDTTSSCSVSAARPRPA